MVLLALITVIIDLGINVGDVVTDFTFGWELMADGVSGERGKESFFTYGTVVWVINWIPGIVAAIYVLSMYRHMMGPRNTIILAIWMLALYPIVPIMAYMMVLWTRPKVLSKIFLQISLLKNQLPLLF